MGWRLLAIKKLTQPFKHAVKQRLPSVWVRWHASHSASFAERELSLLKHIVPRGGIAVDIGANRGVYAEELARIADVVHAFEPSHEMACILRGTAQSNVVVHEV